MALRSKLDSAHVFLALLKQEQLQVLHEYTEAAERHVRSLLQPVIEQIEAGTYDVVGLEDMTPKNEVVSIIDRMSGKNKE